MKKSFKKRVSDLMYFLVRYTIRFLFPAALLLSCLYSCIAYYHPYVNHRAILPHIITYESCNLTLLGLILTLVLGLREGVIHKFLANEAPRVLKTAYWFMFQVCCATVCSILISLVILAVEPWPDLAVKLIVQNLGLTCFGHSLIGTVYLLYYFIYLTVNNGLDATPKPD